MLMENRMRGNAHVRLGGGPEETERTERPPPRLWPTQSGQGPRPRPGRLQGGRRGLRGARVRRAGGDRPGRRRGRVRRVLDRVPALAQEARAGWRAPGDLRPARGAQGRDRARARLPVAALHSPLPEGHGHALPPRPARPRRRRAQRDLQRRGLRAGPGAGQPRARAARRRRAEGVRACSRRPRRT